MMDDGQPRNRVKIDLLARARHHPPSTLSSLLTSTATGSVAEAGADAAGAGDPGMVE